MNYDNMRNMLDDVQTLLEFGDPKHSNQLVMMLV